MQALRKSCCAWAGATIGAAAFMFGVFDDGRVDAVDLRAAGVLIILGCVAWLIARHHPANAAYELGQRDGFRDGYQEGREIARPTVVHLRTCECGRAEVAVSRRNP